MPQIDFQIEAWMIVIVIVVVVIFLAITIIWGIRAHRARVAAGREDLVGKTAEVKIALEPKGVVLVEGERWTAVSESGRLEPGEEVIISRVDSLKLYVIKK